MLRRVIAHVDLFDDHLSFLLQILRIEFGVGKHVGQHIGGQRQVRSGDLAPVDRQLFVCGPVKYAADSFDSLGYLSGRGPPTSALETHVFDEVRGARLFRAFVPGADTNEHTDGHRLHMCHGSSDNRQAIVKHASLVHAVHSSSIIRGVTRCFSAVTIALMSDTAASSSP